MQKIILLKIPPTLLHKWPRLFVGVRLHRLGETVSFTHSSRLFQIGGSTPVLHLEVELTSSGGSPLPSLVLEVAGAALGGLEAGGPPS